MKTLEKIILRAMKDERIKSKEKGKKVRRKET